MKEEIRQRQIHTELFKTLLPKDLIQLRVTNLVGIAKVKDGAVNHYGNACQIHPGTYGALVIKVVRGVRSVNVHALFGEEVIYLQDNFLPVGLKVRLWQRNTP